MPLHDTDLGHHLLTWWLVAWLHQVNTWTNVDLSSVNAENTPLWFHLHAQCIMMEPHESAFPMHGMLLGCHFCLMSFGHEINTVTVHLNLQTVHNANTCFRVIYKNNYTVLSISARTLQSPFWNLCNNCRRFEHYSMKLKALHVEMIN